MIELNWEKPSQGVQLTEYNNKFYQIVRIDKIIYRCFEIQMKGQHEIRKYLFDRKNPKDARKTVSRYIEGKKVYL